MCAYQMTSQPSLGIGPTLWSFLPARLTTLGWLARWVHPSLRSSELCGRDKPTRCRCLCRPGSGRAATARVSTRHRMHRRAPSSASAERQRRRRRSRSYRCRKAGKRQHQGHYDKSDYRDASHDEPPPTNQSGARRGPRFVGENDGRAQPFGVRGYRHRRTFLKLGTRSGRLPCQRGPPFAVTPSLSGNSDSESASRQSGYPQALWITIPLLCVSLDCLCTTQWTARWTKRRNIPQHAA